MASTSQVKAGLDEIALAIREQRAVMEKVKTNAAAVSAALSALPTTHADLISTVNGYAPEGAFETGAKDELARLTAEFFALVADAEAVVAVNLDD